MIKIYDRKNGQITEENVVGGKLLEMLYGKPYGRPFLHLVKRKFFSQLYGKAMDSTWSRKMVDDFISDHAIDMNESLKPASSFQSFNDFFTRKLKPEARPFDSDPNSFCSPADSRLLVFEDIDIDHVIQVKGLTYSLKELLRNDELSERYHGGTVLVFRLNPLDYHRFHFVDDGVAYPTVNIEGLYYSVNPLALKTISRIYVENKRAITKFESRNFGTVLYAEIGATNVGSIIQTHKDCTSLEKGSEKGYFKFGGSTVILYVEKGKLLISDDILKASKEGMETRVLCGEVIGQKPN